MNQDSVMLSPKIFLALLLGLAIGAAGGFFVGSKGARLSVGVGPYSDEFGSALKAIEQAKSKLEAGDCDVMEHLDEAEERIQNCQDWTRKFIGHDE